MKKRVFLIISNVFDYPLEKIDEKSSPDTIESWDSLNHMKLILALEEEFKVEFSDDQIVDMLNVSLILCELKAMNIH